MCTVIGLNLGDRFFGRNLDLEQHFGEQIVLTPRGYRLRLRHEKAISIKNALLGMAAVADGYPLYAEAINEKGLAMAGLNFVGNAAFSAETQSEKQNITTFELIPWVLGQTDTIQEARAQLSSLHLRDTAFSEGMPAAELHWFVTDGREALVLESTKSGIRIYENPLCVLTNNPPFLYQLIGAMPTLAPDPKATIKRILARDGISADSFGEGSVGISGEYSSTARFVRAVRLVQSAKTLGNREADLSTCFQILSAVAPIYGAVKGIDQSEHYTLYSVCANLTRGEFWWRGADSPNPVSVRFSKLPTEGDRLTVLNPEEWMKRG